MINCSLFQFLLVKNTPFSFYSYIKSGNGESGKFLVNFLGEKFVGRNWKMEAEKEDVMLSR